MTNPALLSEAEGEAIDIPETEGVVGSDFEEVELVFQLRRKQQAPA